MSGVTLHLIDGMYVWVCPACENHNEQRSSHLGFVQCSTCPKTSFVTEIVR